MMNYIKSLPELKWYEKENREKRNNLIMKYYEIISGNNEKEHKNSYSNFMNKICQFKNRNKSLLFH